jgi:hypothetical protein
VSERLRLGLSVAAALAALFMALTVYSPASGSLSAACESQSCKDEIAANAWNPIWVIGELLSAAAS